MFKVREIVPSCSPPILLRMVNKVFPVVMCGVLGGGVVMAQAQADPFVTLMLKAKAHAAAHHTKFVPVWSPVETTVLDAGGKARVAAMHAAGVKVVPWTTNDPAQMRAIIAQGVDGLISDRPDLLQQVVSDERSKGNKLEGFDVTAHRGGRGLRPENTLPSFESGMDQGATTLETDTGVTTDGQSLIWHDQFLNPESCRKQDGTPYTLNNRAYTKDMSMAYAQMTFVCDKVHFGADQKNDLALSPVSVAFAKKEGLANPYIPTSAGQLMQFTRFYTEYYSTGAGKNTPHARERAHTGRTVRFNLETKIVPEGFTPEGATPRQAELLTNHTVGAQAFVDALCGAIVKNKMVDRSEVQSFDFRTLLLVQEQYPMLPTYYLTGTMKTLNSALLPESLRAK